MLSEPKICEELPLLYLSSVAKFCTYPTFKVNPLNQSGLEGLSLSYFSSRLAQQVRARHHHRLHLHLRRNHHLHLHQLQSPRPHH